MTKRVFIVVAPLLLYAAAARPGPSEYECHTKEWWEPAATGVLERKTAHPESLAAKSFLAKPFFVDRTNGRVLGASPFGSPSSNEITVVSRGSAQQTFTATYIGPHVAGGRVVTTLTVSESKQGKTKPFVVLYGSTVYNGFCE